MISLQDAVDEAPKDQESYLARFHRNQRIFGFGLETSMSIPCHFCSARDFMVYRVIDTEEAMKKNHTCKECGRSLQSIVVKSENGTTTWVKMYQTGGPDPDPWVLTLPRAKPEESK